MIELGDLVKDSVTGFKGIVTSRTEYLQGCRRLAVQPQELKDGKPIEAHVFDEPQLVLVKARRHKNGSGTGGPRPVPAARPDPARR